MNRVFVKICGITSLEDAQMAVAAGADALGFNFWPGSPRHIAPQAAATITAKLGANTVKIGVFVDPNAVEIAETVRAAGLDLAQIHGPVPPLTLRFWQAFSAAPGLEDDLRAALAASRAEAFLIDTPAGAQRGGTGRAFDWSVVFGLPGKIVLETGYVGTRGTRLAESRALNRAFLASPTNPINGVTMNTVASANLQARVPFQGFTPGGVTRIETYGFSNYNSLQTTVKRQLSRGVYLQGAYPWSKAMTTVTGGGAGMGCAARRGAGAAEISRGIC